MRRRTAAVLGCAAVVAAGMIAAGAAASGSGDRLDVGAAAGFYRHLILGAADYAGAVGGAVLAGVLQDPAGGMGGGGRGGTAGQGVPAGGGAAWTEAGSAVPDTGGGGPDGAAGFHPASGPVPAQGGRDVTAPAQGGRDVTAPAPAQPPATERAPPSGGGGTIHIDCGGDPGMEGVVDAAAAMWSGANPGLSFEVCTGRDGPDSIHITYHDVLGGKKAAGLMTVVEGYAPSRSGYVIQGYAVGQMGGYDGGTRGMMDIEVGHVGCDGLWRRYSDASLTNTIAHEIGHYLGIGHTADRGSLMYGEDDALPILETFGYAVPAPEGGGVGGDTPITREGLRLEARIAEMRGEVDRLRAEIGAMDASTKAGFAMYDGMMARIDRMYDNPVPSREYEAYLADFEGAEDVRRRYNGVVGERNALNDAANGMVDELNRAVDRFNCVENAQ